MQSPTLYFLRSNGNIIANVNVSLRNAVNNNTLAFNISDNETGMVSFLYNSSDFPSINFLARYPSSQYDAVLDSVSCSPNPMINQRGSVHAVVKNTLGEWLEAQDGSVYVTLASDSSQVIKRYDTQCKIGTPYVDDDGNWVSPSVCPVLTDSLGNYVYVFDILEKDGYFYGMNYTAHVVINGIEGVCNFSTTLPRIVDVDKYEGWVNAVSGFIIIFFFIILFILILRFGWRKWLR